MRNPAGTLFCLGCARPIGAMAPAAAVAAPAAAAVASRTLSLVEIDNLAPTGLAFTLPATDYDGTLTIGRNDLAGGVVVDVDLTAHAGQVRHVSRRHVRLHYAGGLVHAEDAGSLHGTYVNKQRLADGQREPLADGDELRLAEMVFRVALR